MKKIFTLILSLLGGLSYLSAQQEYEPLTYPTSYQQYKRTDDALLPDQNPAYRQSQNKYLGMKDSLLASSNTTVQDTYKAYDFYEARQERRALRKERRYNVRMTRAENGWYTSPYYGNYGSYNNGYNSWYNLGYYGRFIPNVGFRSGNWRFGW